MQNAKELYEYSREVFQAEKDLFYAIERKVGQYFSAFGFLLSASGVTIGLTLNRFVPPHGRLEITLFVLSLLLAAGLLITVFFLLKAIRVAVFGIPPLTPEMIKFFEENSEEAVHRGLALRMGDVIKKNRMVIKERAKH